MIILRVLIVVVFIASIISLVSNGRYYMKNNMIDMKGKEDERLDR